MMTLERYFLDSIFEPTDFSKEQLEAIQYCLTKNISNEKLQQINPTMSTNNIKALVPIKINFVVKK